ncbi:hypothetical protein HYQ46_003468 [Verticillium longisporum]|nr:hypothetical protein HYQ46_003468 [Verticillium longisporum]
MPRHRKSPTTPAVHPFDRPPSPYSSATRPLQLLGTSLVCCPSFGFKPLLLRQGHHHAVSNHQANSGRQRLTFSVSA